MMITQHQREMNSLACALSWELDKLLPRPTDDAHAWDPIACALVRRMIREQESASLAYRIRMAADRGRILVASMSPGGEA